MSVLTNAIEAANERKLAVGLPDDGTLKFTESTTEDRMVFGGFDLDYDEVAKAVEAAGSFFTMQACGEHPLIPLFRACWADGLLTGLMVPNNVAPHHDPPDPHPVGGEDSGDE
jgi:hypothetical protein